MPRTVLSSSRTSVLRKPENIEKGSPQDARHVPPRGSVIDENLTRLAAIEDCGYANYNAHDESIITKTRWLTETCGQGQEAYLPGSVEQRDKQEASLARSFHLGTASSSMCSSSPAGKQVHRSARKRTRRYRRRSRRTSDRQGRRACSDT